MSSFRKLMIDHHHGINCVSEWSSGIGTVHIAVYIEEDSYIDIDRKKIDSA